MHGIMNRLLPLLGILAGIALLTMNVVNTASAQTAAEYALIISLLTHANFKNQGHCISQLPDMISNAHIIPNASPQEIRQLSITICKQAFSA